jgi:thiol-disulfide isomerase/thioredoxin
MRFKLLPTERQISTEIDQNRRRFVGYSTMAIVAAHLGLTGCADAQSNEQGVRLVREGSMPSLEGATEWLNSPPLSSANLRGKVVLVNFWTFSCINSLRQLPYLRAWAEKYKEQGLAVVGVQAPEFEFEKNLDDVRWARKTMKLDYPIAIDNDHAIWRAFNNTAWPALYFVDATGCIRHHQLGEGNYERAELVIQQLLAEIGTSSVASGFASIDARGAEAPANWNSLRSPETYLGYQRAERFASRGGAATNKSHNYVPPAHLKLNQWALSGDWTIHEEGAVLNRMNGGISYRFHARDLHLVMGPANRVASVRFRVLIDQQPPLASHGSDIDVQGNGTIVEQRLYQLIRQPEPIADRQFDIEFLDPGAEAFVFTFG